MLAALARLAPRARPEWRALAIPGGVLQAARPLLGPVAAMSIFKSHAVKEWVAKQPDSGGTSSGGISWKYWSAGRSPTGKWIGPRLDAKTRARIIKRAISQGEIFLEPTVMVPPPHFKGKGRHRRAEERRVEIKEKLAMMPQMVREHKQALREKRRALRKDSFFKNTLK
ncbi:hypothetical protein AB1Y20_000794 [Prymnesium parvum]|uniref:MRPL25 domain-containing protein n=1 Tax=Prymnesium parvum TaxID=97485 RepID=A0AB34K5U0_PRYPA